MNRRGFLGSILALGVAPAVVRASSLMPIAVLEAPRIVLADAAALGGNRLLTIEMITQEALRILENNLVMKLDILPGYGLLGTEEFHTWKTIKFRHESAL